MFRAANDHLLIYPLYTSCTEIEFLLKQLSTIKATDKL